MNLDEEDFIDLASDDTQPLPDCQLVEPTAQSSRKCFVFERVGVCSESTSASSGCVVTLPLYGPPQLRPALTAEEILEDIECWLINITEELENLQKLSTLFQQVRKEEEEAGASFPRRSEGERSSKEKSINNNQNNNPSPSYCAPNSKKRRRSNEEEIQPSSSLQENQRHPDSNSESSQ